MVSSSSPEDSRRYLVDDAALVDDHVGRVGRVKVLTGRVVQEQVRLPQLRGGDADIL